MNLINELNIDNMTPKEKAEELVKKMYLVHSNTQSNITNHFAKQCALITVDEMINETSLGTLLIDWWYEVRNEIKLL